jgi:superfamily II DNA or RNA helicase
MTTPVRFSGRVLQYLGRVLRPANGVEKARVYDYVDIHVQPLVAAANARQRIYSGSEPSASPEPSAQQS